MEAIELEQVSPYSRNKWVLTEKGYIKDKLFFLKKANDPKSGLSWWILSQVAADGKEVAIDGMANPFEYLSGKGDLQLLHLQIGDTVWNTLNYQFEVIEHFGIVNMSNGPRIVIYKNREDGVCTSYTLDKLELKTKDVWTR